MISHDSRANGMDGATILVGGRVYRWDPRVFHDLAHPVTFSGSDPSAFGLTFPRAAPLPGAVHAATVHDLNPHTATHVEGRMHIDGRGDPISGLLERSLFPATLATILPERGGDGDARVLLPPLAARLGPFDPFQEALVLRILSPEWANARFSGTNPPYLAEDAARFLADRGTRVLVVDLPSVDREEDGGALAAHRAFLVREEPPGAIVELACIPSAAADGRYLMQIAPPRWSLDAAPVRPILYPVTP